MLKRFVSKVENEKVIEHAFVIKIQIALLACQSRLNTLSQRIDNNQIVRHKQGQSFVMSDEQWIILNKKFKASQKLKQPWY